VKAKKAGIAEKNAPMRGDDGKLEGFGKGV